jgi:hypothetical protein
MRKIIPILGIVFIIASGLQAPAQAGAEEKLLQEAKVLIFDEKWDLALAKLDEILHNNPAGPLAGQATYYRAKCLAKQEGRERDALTAFKGYLQMKDTNRSLAEESESAIIDLALALTNKGDKSYLKDIEERLESPNKAVRFYAAYQLSYVKDKQAAAKAVPILKKFISEEADDRLRDRAKIALLRVDPNALEESEKSQPDRDRGTKVLVIQVLKAGRKSPELSIKIPWSLADLAINAIPEDQKEMIRKQKGFDLKRILDDLTKIEGNLIEITEEDETIKIWIEWIKK